jgi:serine/threonine protein kinase
VLLARASGLEGFARHVVIKRIQPELSREERFVKAFLEEARIAASLHHQNIVQVHDIGDEGGSYYFAMEYVHGEDCRKLIARLRERNEMMPLQLVVSIVMATAAGLHYAHEQVNPQTGESKGIVHRDVSPANILIGYDGSVKIVDFGLARAAARSTNATQSGTLKGKSSYMSPEQCTGRALDRRTDTWSLGIVLFELLTAQRLFKGSNEFMTMAAIVDGEIPRPSTLRADVPPALDEIIIRALSRSPESRYQTAESLRESLEAFAVANELRISNKALGDYLTSLFGERQEPWLVSEVTPEPSWRDLESSHSGVVSKPRNQAQMIAQFTGESDSQDSPMALAQSLGAGEWIEDDERESTSNQLPSLRRFGQPTEPTQAAKPPGRPTPLPGPAARPTPPQGPATRPTPQPRTTPAPGVNVNVRPRGSEPPHASTVNPNVRPRASEPPPAQEPKKNDEITAVLANEPIRVGDPPAKLLDDPETPDFTQTQKAKPKRDEGSSTLVEPPIFDPLVRNERDDDDDGLDEDEPATEIALDAPVHVPDPPKEKMPMALRRPVRQPVPMQEELPRAPDVAPQPLRPVGRVQMPGSSTQAGMGVVSPRENTPPTSPPAPIGPGGYPGSPSFAGVDPAQIAAGFQPPRASSDMIYTGAPAPDVSLRGSNRVFVILVIVVVVIVGALFAIRSCGNDSTSPSAAPADAEVEGEDAAEEQTDKPDASVRARDAGVRADAAKTDDKTGDKTDDKAGDKANASADGSAAGSGSAEKKLTLPPKRPPLKRPKGK